MRKRYYDLIFFRLIYENVLYNNNNNVLRFFFHQKPRHFQIYLTAAAFRKR